MAVGSKPVEADAGIERRADPAGEDFGDQREPTRTLNPEMIQVDIVARIKKRIRVREIVERIGTDRACDLDQALGGDVTQIVGRGGRIIRRGGGAEVPLDSIDLEGVREVLAIGMRRIGAQGDGRGIGQPDRSPPRIH